MHVCTYNTIIKSSMWSGKQAKLLALVDNLYMPMKKKLKRLPSNLKSTTRECLHSVARDDFRSRDKNGGHTIRFAIAENPTLHANLTVVFYGNGFIADRSLRESYVRFFLLPWPWPWPDDLHIRTWLVSLPDMPDVQLRTSYIKAFESYRITNKQTLPKLQCVSKKHSRHF